jgi:pimeloyl-ACP methyl ester carboxylesterase
MQEGISSVSEKSTTGRSNLDPAIRVTPSMAVMGAVMRGVHRVSPALGARVAARVFLTPRRAAVPEREHQWLKRAEPRDFDLDRFRLAGHQWAKSGPVVLLVHGWEGRGSQLGGFAVALAELGYQPIGVDLPAHGRSAGAQTNLLEFAHSVRALVKSFGSVAGIVAHSFGAAATTVALRDGLDVGRLVYVAPSEDFDHFPRVFGRSLGLPQQLSERMKRTIERRLGATMAELRGGLIATKMKAPLLIVHDEDDVDVPLQDGKTYESAWPGARLVTTRGLGHRRILRDPAVLEAAAGFFGPAPKEARC